MAHRFRTIRARNTTQAGYGAQHQRERKRRLAITTEHDRCGYCGQPLGPLRLPGERQDRWALPHNADRTGYLPGMWHRHCNNLDGAKRGNQRQRMRRQPRAQSRNW